MEAFRPRRHDLLDPFDLAAFRAELQGELILPGGADYDVARLAHNTIYDRQPTFIVKAAGAGDVARTVVLARDAGMSLAVRSGGHSLAGHSTVDDGIVLDLSGMKGLHIDVEARTAWAQPGLTAGEYTAAAAAHGLATPFGDTGSVGIAGLTLGGGIGWLVRKYGLAIDALQAVEIVTADGRLITANADHHPDLFWAVRGGGGNFGVVTRFQFQLYPVETVLGGALFLPPTADVLRSLEPIAANAPEELTTISFLMPIPPVPFVPAERHGELSLILMFVWSGDPADGNAALEPFRQVATPIAEAVMPMPYIGIYQFTEGAEAPGRGVVRSRFMNTLSDAAIESILSAMAVASPTAIVQIRVLGGAMARVPADGDRLRPSGGPGHGRDHRPLRGPRARTTPSSPGPRGSMRRSHRTPRCLLELPPGRGRGSPPRRVPGWHVRAARRDQASLRPDQPLPPEPEHPSGRQPRLRPLGSVPGRRRPGGPAAFACPGGTPPEGSRLEPSAPMGRARHRRPRRRRCIRMHEQGGSISDRGAAGRLALRQVVIWRRSRRCVVGRRGLVSRRAVVSRRGVVSWRRSWFEERVGVVERWLARGVGGVRRGGGAGCPGRDRGSGRSTRSHAVPDPIAERSGDGRQGDDQDQKQERSATRR